MHAKGTAWDDARSGSDLGGFVGSRGNASAKLVEPHTVGRQREAPRRPMKQTNADTFFETGHPRADGRFRDAQRSRREAERASFDDASEEGHSEDVIRAR